jgi:integrase
LQVKEFKEWIEKQSWSSRTKDSYLFWFDKFLDTTRDFDKLQERVDQFCYKFLASPARAMIKNYLIYTGRHDIIIPKIRGRQRRKLPVCLTVSDVIDFADWCDNNGHRREGLIIRFLFETGLRINECVNVRVKDLDFKNNKVRGIGKGNKDFIQMFQAGTAERIKKSIEARLLDPDDIVFPLTPETASMNIKRCARKALKRNDISAHTMRHSCATHLLKMTNNDLITVNKYLRHDKIETTMRYLHVENININKKVNDAFS